MNLDPAGNYADFELWKALENAHLKKFAEELKEGLDFECGDGGSNLR